MARRCSYRDCKTLLSEYNPNEMCWLHENLVHAPVPKTEETMIERRQCEMCGSRFISVLTSESTKCLGCRSNEDLVLRLQR